MRSRRASTHTVSPWIPCVLALLYAGCALDPVAPTPSPEPDAVDGGLRTLAGELPAARCDGSELTWPSDDPASQVCEGPWAYERNGTCQLEHESCGAKVCDTYRSCPDWDRKYRTTATIPHGYDAKVVVIPPECYQRPGRKTCTKPRRIVLIEQARERCDDYVASDLASARARVPAAYRAGVTASSSFRVNQITARVTCDVTVRSYAAPSTRRAACGCAVPLHDPACTVTDASCNNTTGVTIYSSPGLARSQLAADDEYGEAALHVKPAVCTTCEELPIDTPAEVRAKYACLLDAWQRTFAPDPASGAAEAPAPRGGAAQRLAPALRTAKAVKTTIHLSTPVLVAPVSDADPYVVPDGPGRGRLDASTREALAQRMMLLYELRGEHLDDAARGFVRGLYASYPERVVDCGFETPTWPDSACDAPTHALLSSALRCERLAAQGSDALALVSLDSCATTLEQLALAGPGAVGCEIAGARDALADALSGLAQRAVRVLRTPDAAYASLPHVLFALDRFYEATLAARQARAAQGDEALEPAAAAAAATNEVLAAFWLHAQYGREVFDGLRDAPDVQAAIEGATARGTQLDRDVLAAAFSDGGALPAIVDDLGHEVVAARSLTDRGGLPMQSPALAAVTDGALGGLNQRIESMIEMHDFACQLLQCGAEVYTPVSRLWSLLGATGDAARLTDLLAATPDDLDGWRASFAAIRAGHAALAPLLDGDPESLDPLSLPLASRVAAAAERARAYADAGQLAPSPKRALHAGLNSQQRAVVTEHLRAQLTLLDVAVGEYQSSLLALLAGLSAGEELDAAAERLGSELHRLSTQYAEAESDLAGLRRNQSEDAGHLADLVAAYETVSDSIDEGAFLQATDAGSSTFTVGPDEATFDGTYRGAISSLTDRLPVSVPAGRMLRVLVDGSWAPTCSLRTVGDVLDPDDYTRAEPIDFAGVYTGPAGFSLTYSEGRHRAYNHADTDSSTHTVSAGAKAQVCAGGGTPGKDFIGIGMSWEACVYAGYDYSSRWGSQTDRSQGTERRSAAAFSAGLRLPNTPFPDLPVGALLAVLLPSGETDPAKATDVRVLRAGENVLLTDQASDVHLVVNDLGTCDAHDLSRVLTVTHTQLVPAGEVAIAAVGVMQTLVEGVRDLRDRFLRQGAISPTELAAIRSWANFQLDAALDGVEAAQLPSPLRTLFDAFLDRELVGLERALRIQQAERALRVLELQLLAVADEITHNQRRGQLSTLTASWHLRHLDSDAARGQVGYTMEQARAYLYPVLELWYPAVLEEIRAAPSAAYVRGLLTTLRDARPSAWTMDLITTAKQALSAVLDVYSTAQPGDPVTGYKPVIALSFINPYAVDEFADAESTEGAETGEAGAPVLSELPKAEDDFGFGQVTRSERVWDALLAHRPVDITLRPEDVYGGATGGSLSCSFSTPVIERMAVVVIRKDKGADAKEKLAKFNQYRRLRGLAGEDQPFATPDGLVSYTLSDNPDTVADENVWRSFDLPLVYTSFETPIDSFRELVLDNDSRPDGALGLSPFGTLTIDFSAFEEFAATTAGDGLGAVDDAGEKAFDAVELALLMQVSGRQVLDDLPWVDGCFADDAPPLDDPFGDGEAPGTPDDGGWF